MLPLPGQGAALATLLLSPQGEEGQIGPAGLNSSEGPKVSTGSHGAALSPTQRDRDVATLPCHPSVGASIQGTASRCHPRGDQAVAKPGESPDFCPPLDDIPASATCRLGSRAG